MIRLLPWPWSSELVSSPHFPHSLSSSCASIPQTWHKTALRPLYVLSAWTALPWSNLYCLQVSLSKCHLIGDVTDHSMSKAKPSAQPSLFLSPNFILLHSAYHRTLHFCICQLSPHTAGFGSRKTAIWGVLFSILPTANRPEIGTGSVTFKNCWINKWKNFRDLKTSCSLMPGHMAAGWSWRMFHWSRLLQPKQLMITWVPW